MTLRCRGGVRLFDEDREIALRSRKARALLAILAAERRPITRTRLVDLLWSDRQEEQARASLRTVLVDLKQQLGDKPDRLLTVNRESLALSLAVRTDLDHDVFPHSPGELFEGLDHLDPELDEWLRLQRARFHDFTSAERPPSPIADRAPRRRPWPLWGVAALLLAALAAGALLSWQSHEREPAVLAVLPIRDTTGQNAYLADGLTEDLRLHLTDRTGLQVIGRQSSESPLLIAGGSAAARRMLSATHVVEGTLLAGRPLRLSIRLTDTESSRVIWNHVVEARPSIMATGPAPIANLVAAEITDTVEQAGPAFAFEADPAAYRDLFRARQILGRFDSAEMAHARQLLGTVIDRNPRFVPALAAYAEATIRSSDHPFYRGTLPLREARAEGERYAQRAIKLAPDYGPAYLALGQVRVETPAALAPLSRAVELSPSNYRARYRLARALDVAGDTRGAIFHQRRAVQLEPLDPNPLTMLADYLIYSINDQAEVDRLLGEYLARSPDPYDALHVTSHFAGLKGDYSRMLETGVRRIRLRPGDRQARRTVMGAYASLGMNDRAVSFADPGSVSHLILRGDEEGLLRKASELGPDFWMLSFETSAAVDFLASRGRWTDLVRLYDRGGRRLSQDMRGYASLVIALRAARRGHEAEELMAQGARLLEKVTNGTPALIKRAWYLEYNALSGRDGDALSSLEACLRLGLPWLTGYYERTLESASLRHLRAHPRFILVRRQFYREHERERREAVEVMRSLGGR